MTETTREDRTTGEPIEVRAFRQREAARTYGAAGWSYTQLIAAPAAPTGPAINSLFAR